MAALFKNNGSPQLSANYSDVTLADGGGKIFGGDLRTHAKKKLIERALPGMYGSGLNGGRTEVAHLR